MKKKIIVVSLIVSLVAIAIVGSSLAFFSDTDEKVNVFTVGKIDIDQLERAQGKVAVDVPAAPMAMMSLSEATVLTLRMSLN